MAVIGLGASVAPSRPLHLSCDSNDLPVSLIPLNDELLM